MKRLFFLTLALTGCVSDFFVPLGLDAAGDVSPDIADAASLADTGSDMATDAPMADVPVDTMPADTGSDACTTISGGAACNTVLDAYCTKAKSCGYWPTVSDCRSWMNVNFPKFDCSMSNYNKLVCTDSANQCASDVTFVSCGTIQTKLPDQTNASCTKFFSQFP